MLSLTVLLLAAPAWAACGVERWPVKIGADADFPANLLSPLPTTVAALSALPPPPNPDARRDSRFLPVEGTVFSLDATITLVKHEADGDYHIVVSDGSATMIVEAPDPACATGSKVATQIAEVQADIERRFGGPVRGRHTALAIPVTVTGLGFFDKCHGQEGRAYNCIELHPLLAIKFLN